MNDLDSHVQPSLDNYEAAAGQVGREFAESIREQLQILPPEQSRQLRNLMGEEGTTFDERTVWTIKGSAAPGACTPEGRLRTLDTMGIDRALIFSDPAVQAYAFGPGELGAKTMRHWNDFVLQFAARDRNRLRVAALLNTWDVEVATAEIDRVLALGGRAFVIASSVLPGGASPARPQMDPIWARIAEAKATVCLHIGGEHGFMGSQDWGKGVEHLSFRPHDFTSEVEQINTYTFSSFHYSPQNFITTMLLGGVFERHPTLRFAAIELGAGWVGPMAERADQVAQLFAKRVSPVLSMKPSEYVRRNIRVTPFRFEPVADYIDRYGLEECYCFSSDFPHPEGGTRPIEEFHANIERKGDAMMERLFVTNAEWVLPPL